MIADYMFYGYNKEAVKEYQRLSGIQIRMTYPSELNKKEMEQLELLNADLFLYGYQPLMVSAQCVKNNLRGCDKTPSWLTLKDRYNANFIRSHKIVVTASMRFIMENHCGLEMKQEFLMIFIHP